MSQITNIKYIFNKLVAIIMAAVAFVTSLFTGGGGMDLSQVTAADYAQIKTAYTAMILGPENLDLTDNTIQSKINGIVGAGLYYQSILVKDGNAPWVGGVKITDSPQISTIYANTFYMARAYACKQGSVYHNASLLADVLYTLDWMVANGYGKDVNELTKFGNWWDWEIGGPTQLVKTLVLIENALDSSQIDKYLFPVNYFVPTPERTSANLVDSAYIVIGAGALQQDGKKLYKARQKLDEVFKYVTSGDGFYTDGSYVMHVDIPYQGGYGTIMLEALSRVIVALDGTFFAISPENIATQAAWAFDSYLPLMFKGGLPGMVRGRNIVRNTDDIGIGYAAVIGMLRMTKYTNDADSQKLASAVKYYYNENSARYASSAELFDYCLFKALVNDNAVEAMQALDTVKVFPKMDRVSKLTENYSVGISMASKRIAKHEAINNENGKGWYTGDGMLYIGNTPDDFNYEYWSGVNFYRMPGTTVTTRERTDKNLLVKSLPNTAFAGGVTLDNCAAVSMQLLGTTTDFTSTLKAKKSWFLFDDEIVALGADINCSDAYSTETIIENRRINENSVFASDGYTINDNAGKLNNAKSIYLSGLGGIYLSDGAIIRYKKTNSDVNFLELWIDHGVNIKEASYSYTILPAKTSGETIRYAENPDIQILSNTACVQAVRENKLGLTGYVFHRKGEFEEISVDKPCIIMKKQMGDSVTYTIAEPTQGARRLHVWIAMNGFEALEKDETIKCCFSGEKAFVSVNTASKSGLGASITFVKK